jgi:hypothetical protein
MQNPKDVESYLRAQAEHARVSDEVFAVSDGRVSGSGTEDRRGHRDLHEHFAGSGNMERPYSGPKDYYPITDRVGSEHEYQKVEDRYPTAGNAGNRVEPFWGGDDCRPSYDYNSDTGRRRR